MWKLFVEHGEDISKRAFKSFFGMKPSSEEVSEGTRTMTYLFQSKEEAVTAKRQLKARYRAKIHCEIVPV
jgi:hypothetical protein